MDRRLALCLVGLIVAANAAAVLLYSGAGPVDSGSGAASGGAGGWHPILRAIAEGLTLPIPTREIADVRDGVLPAALGAGLLLVGGATLRRGRAVGAEGGRRGRACENRGARPTGEDGATGTVGGDGRIVPAGTAAERARPTGGSTHDPERAAEAERGVGLHRVGRVARSGAEGWLWETAGAVLIIAVLSAAGNGRFDLSWGWIVRFAAGAAWAVLIARTLSGEWAQRTTGGLLGVGLVCLILSVWRRADSGLAHFTWPIGPITSTAAFAALWGALAAGRSAAALMERRIGRGACFLALFLIATYVLQQTHRRAPMLGLLAGLGAIGAAGVWRRYRSRRAGILLAGAGLAAIVAAAGYVTVQLRSGETEVSGPLALRFAFWRIAGSELMPGHLSLGSGPDTFVIEMTDAVAPYRAVSPHFYHGNINLYAHNEWIQAAVELGLPGALFYLGLPVGILFFAWRRAATAGSKHAEIPALIAGLVTILVTESASISLRGPMMPVWYWTLIGLTTALCGPGVRQTEWLGGRAAVRGLCLIAAGLGFLGASLLDLAHARAEAGGSRLYAGKTVVDRYRAAVAGYGDEGSVERWAALWALIPSFRDTAARYADVLLRAGRAAEARAVLEDALDRLDPYSPESNLLYARLRMDDPVARLECVHRALRNAALGGALRELLADLAEAPSVGERLRAELPKARRAAAARAPPGPRDGPAEWLRIGAFVAFAEGRIETALDDQRLAAESLALLERTNNRYRRGHAAETDVFFTLARRVYAADPGAYAEAYEAIVKAERYAVLGIRHERVARPQPARGFVGGVVVPTEFPPHLLELWRFSALLHLMTGHADLLVARVQSFLPAPERTEAGIRRALAGLYREAHAALSRLPAAERPEHYAALGEMARALEGRERR